MHRHNSGTTGRTVIVSVPINLTGRLLYVSANVCIQYIHAWIGFELRNRDDPGSGIYIFVGLFRLRVHWNDFESQVLFL